MTKFTSVLPARYDRRWPHIHFEVFKTIEVAGSGDKGLPISQFAIPQKRQVQTILLMRVMLEAQQILGGGSIAQDMVFGDNPAEQIAAPTLNISGDSAAGLGAIGTIAI